MFTSERELFSYSIAAKLKLSDKTLVLLKFNRVLLFLQICSSTVTYQLKY